MLNPSYYKAGALLLRLRLRAGNPETAAVTADTAVETATAHAAAAVTAEPAGTAAETETDYLVVAAAAEAVADTAATVSMTAD